MRYALALALVASLSFGLVYESFRNQSTAGLFEDDYDIIFDPARICEIEGARVWTSLSNFVNGYEHLFENGSVPFIMVGGTKSLAGMYPAFVYDRSSQQLAMPTGLYTPSGSEIYGDGIVTEVDWDDTDNNGSYDVRTIESLSRSAYQTDKENAFYAGLGYRRDKIRLGLGFINDASSFIDTDPAENFAWVYTVEDLASNAMTFIDRARSEGDHEFGFSENRIRFSVWYDMERMSAGLMADYAMLSGKTFHVIAGDSAQYTDPSDTTTFYTYGTMLDSLNQPFSGSEIDVRLQLFYDYNENAQGRYYVGVYTGSMNYGDDAVGWLNMTREDMDTDMLWDTSNTFTYYDGSYSEQGIRLGTSQHFTVSDRLKLAFGVMLSTATYSDSVTARDTLVDVEVYDDNDGIAFDPDDYVSTIWSSETWMTRTTGAEKAIQLPVGMEFYFFQPLVLRLGAVHTWDLDDYTVVHNLIQYEPERTRTVLGDGTVTETLDDPGQEPVGSEESYYDKTPTTNYSYGIGWNVNENLQIDLMGFSDLTDLSNWRLSATLKF